jgi:hypothetical protein
LTGTLFSEQEQAAQPLLNQLTSLGEAWKRGTPEQQAQYATQATQIRNQLSQMGIDPSLYDPSLSTEQRREAVGGLGTKTQAAREFEQEVAYQEARNKILDDRYVAEFDRDNERFGLEFALDKAVKNRQLGQEDARIAIARDAETRLAKQREEKATEEVGTDDEEAASADNFNYLQDSYRGMTAEEAFADLRKHNNDLTTKDYRALGDWIDKNL